MFYIVDLDLSNTVTYNTTVLCPKHGINGSLIIPGPVEDSPYWGLHSTVPIYVALIVFPLLNFRDVSFFTRFNSLGKYLVLVNLVDGCLKVVNFFILIAFSTYISLSMSSILNNY